MRITQSFAWSLAALLLVVSGIALAQDANQNRTLIVNGQSATVSVIQVNGRSYVDLEALARALNGSLSFSGNQIALSVSGSPANSNTTSANTTSATRTCCGSSFEAGIFASVLDGGYRANVHRPGMAYGARGRYSKWNPCGGKLASPYRNQAATNLRLASVAIKRIRIAKPSSC